jgi:flagellar hook-basal body complex protein FliE
MAPILPVNLSIPPIVAPAAGASAAGTGGAFQSVLTDAISQVESITNNANASIQGLLSDDGEELHQKALKTQEANMSFNLFLQVRNKIIAAYTSVMNMQV